MGSARIMALAIQCHLFWSKVSTPPEVVEKARKHGLNISKVSENALIDIINRIEGSDGKEGLVFSVNAFGEKGSWCGGRDLDPCSPKARDLESCAYGPQEFDLALPPPPDKATSFPY